MLEKAYSKDAFGINFPLLVTENMEYEWGRYYVDPLTIRGKQYKLCNDWYESSNNNDRKYLLEWLESHKIID